MNYPYTQQIESHFLTKKIGAKMLTEVLFDQLMSYRDCVNSGMLNTLDSHDTACLLTLAGGNKDRALCVLAFGLVQPGSPSIYYGTEMAMTDDNGPDCREPMGWTKEGDSYWQEAYDLVKFRHKYSTVSSRGDIKSAIKDELIVIKHDEITVYSNTSSHEVEIIKKCSVSNGYQNGVLSPSGYILCERHR